MDGRSQMLARIKEIDRHLKKYFLPHYIRSDLEQERSEIIATLEHQEAQAQL